MQLKKIESANRLYHEGENHIVAVVLNVDVEPQVIYYKKMTELL